MDIFLTLLLDNKRVKMYNPHCPNFRKCLGGNMRLDCFGCNNMRKITEDYIKTRCQNEKF